LIGGSVNPRRSDNVVPPERHDLRLLASANAPILTGVDWPLNIFWRMPPQGWLTTVHQSVVCCHIQKTSEFLLPLSRT
jgi:hypothetical protein